ncbi:MAG: GNAT family N-acetyltransferase [Clostridia bacterium]|nr:GNAT family N-acetyltransferase [Clostridia bacterium]
MSVTLVPVTEEHIPALCALQYAAFLPLYERYHDERNPAFKGEGELRRQMESPDFFPYAILENDTVVGGITVKRLPDSVYYLARLYVDPARQRHGIASAAIRICESFFPDAARWTLDFPRDMEPNRRTYEKAGYRDTGEIRVINDLLTLAMYARDVHPLRTETYDALTAYYNRYDEEGRLLSNHGQVEYRTTMRYIHRYLHPGARILEIGAGTGRYSLALAAEGYAVTAVELIPHNLTLLREKIVPGMSIETYEGNALDLSFLPAGAYDMVLLLGPVYHLYREEDKITALKEALRLTRSGGVLGIAYCMADPTAFQYCFHRDENGNYRIHDLRRRGLVDDDFRLYSTPEELFELIRPADADRLLSRFHGQADRLHFVGTDMCTGYMRDNVDAMDAETFRLFLRYHDTICERTDLVGASHHTLDIWKKR